MKLKKINSYPIFLLSLTVLYNREVKKSFSKQSEMVLTEMKSDAKQRKGGNEDEA